EDARYGTWDAERIRHLFGEEDANHILGMKTNLQRSDAVVWGCSRSGTYDSQSGYKLLNLLHTIENPMTVPTLPPIETKLWSNLWKMSGVASLAGWQKPCPSFIKCNIGSSWIDASRNCGVAWLTRNHYGVSLAHSRRSYSVVPSPLEVELLCFYWAVESLSTMRYEKVGFESTSYLAGEAVLNPENFPHLSGLIGAIREKFSLLRLWSIAYVHKEANRCSDAIALSVTRDHRYTSYIAKDGPGWLLQMILEDAVGAYDNY
ncbi:hypothetical protein HID58_055822, partial [Brassica napus]